METATITGNVFHNYNSSGGSKMWSALEVNNCKDVVLTSNEVKGIFTNGDYGDGYGF